MTFLEVSEMNKTIDTNLIIQKESQTVKTGISTEIKVTVHVPEQLHERVRQQKINRIYDILNPKKSH